MKYVERQERLGTPAYHEEEILGSLQKYGRSES